MVPFNLKVFANVAFARVARKNCSGARLLVLEFFFNCSHARILVNPAL